MYDDDECIRWTIDTEVRVSNNLGDGASDRIPNTHEVDRPYSMKQQLRRCVVKCRWRDADDVEVRVTGEVKGVGLFGSVALDFFVENAGNAEAVSARSASSSPIHRRTLAPGLIVHNLTILTLTNSGFLSAICLSHMSELFVWCVGGLMKALCLTYG